MQQTEKAAAKTKTQGLRHLGLVAQRRIVQFEFFQRVAQSVVLVGLGRVQTGKHLGLDFFEPRQSLGGGGRSAAGTGFDQRDGIAYFGRLQFFDAGDDVTHLTGFQRLARLVGGREYT